MLSICFVANDDPFETTLECSSMLETIFADSATTVNVIAVAPKE
jgi:hypothetical protein